MLETPITGRYTREERHLVFEPNSAYMTLVYGCMGMGGVVSLWSLVGQALHITLTAGAVSLAGVWAYFSVIRITFDNRTKRYRRRQGPGFIPRLWQGRVDEIDAIVVIAEPAMMPGGIVRYHMVLHWKHSRAPLMVIESVPVQSTGNLQADGRGMVARATKYGATLGLPVYDNTHFASKCPVPVF